MADMDILQSFKPREDSINGILWLDGEIWTISAESKLLSGYSSQEDKFDIFKEVSYELKNPGDITWNGNEFLVPEKVEKVIYKLDPENKELKLYQDLLKLQASPILKAEDSTVPSIGFNNDKIWLTCEAGYSSSIFCLDTKSKELIKTFFTRGPKPKGISFEKNDNLGWVLDSSNKELSQFDLNGEWTGEIHNVPLEKPSGLTIDDEDMFWTIDRKTNKIFQLSRGD